MSMIKMNVVRTQNTITCEIIHVMTYTFTETFHVVSHLQWVAVFPE